LGSRGRACRRGGHSDGIREGYAVTQAPVAQRKSIGLLIRRSGVRILPGALRKAAGHAGSVDPVRPTRLGWQRKWQRWPVTGRSGPENETQDAENQDTEDGSVPRRDPEETSRRDLFSSLLPLADARSSRELAISSSEPIATSPKGHRINDECMSWRERKTCPCTATSSFATTAPPRASGTGVGR
jgi:hypothetical protein